MTIRTDCIYKIDGTPYRFLYVAYLHAWVFLDIAANRKHTFAAAQVDHWLDTGRMVEA